MLAEGGVDGELVALFEELGLDVAADAVEHLEFETVKTPHLPAWRSLDDTNPKFIWTAGFRET